MSDQLLRVVYWSMQPYKAILIDQNLVTKFLQQYYSEPWISVLIFFWSSSGDWRTPQSHHYEHLYVDALSSLLQREVSQLPPETERLDTRWFFKQWLSWIHLIKLYFAGFYMKRRGTWSATARDKRQRKQGACKKCINIINIIPLWCKRTSPSKFQTLQICWKKAQFTRYD